MARITWSFQKAKHVTETIFVGDRYKIILRIIHFDIKHAQPYDS